MSRNHEYTYAEKAGLFTAALHDLLKRPRTHKEITLDAINAYQELSESERNAVYKFLDLMTAKDTSEEGVSADTPETLVRYHIRRDELKKACEKLEAEDVDFDLDSGDRIMTDDPRVEEILDGYGIDYEVI